MDILAKKPCKSYGMFFLRCKLHFSSLVINYRRILCIYLRRNDIQNEYTQAAFLSYSL